MAQNQKGRLCRIKTVLDDDGAESHMGGDPLLLIKFDAEEGISVPYQYDVVIYRETERNKKRPLRPSMLIGTRAFIHSRGQDQRCEDFPNLQLIREGVFISLEEMDAEDPDLYIKFAGRLVAPFKLLDYEVRFRVFENKTVDQILKEVLLKTGDNKPAPVVPPETLDFGGLKNANLSRLEYCVQFNETTFNFLSRLMREYGIWYYFGNRHASKSQPPADNGMMVFGTGEFIAPGKVRSQSVGQNPKMRIDNDPPRFEVNIPLLDLGDNPGWTISAWKRSAYGPNFIDLNVGNFNIVNPVQPIDGTDEILDGFNTLNDNGSYDRSRHCRQMFPAPVWLNQRDPGSGHKIDEYEDAVGYADTRLLEEDSAIFGSSGVSKNPTFIPGLAFDVDKDLTNRDDFEPFHTFLLLGVKTSAYDLHYDHVGASAIMKDIMSNFFGSQSASDVTLAFVSAGLNQWLQNYINPEQQIFFGSSDPNKPPFSQSFQDYFIAGFFANVTTLLPGLVKNITELLDKTSHSGFSNGIICTDDGRAVPLPKGAKPVASGPHLAVVIGPDGVDTKKGELHADVLGRVRVRFPWDRRLHEKPGDGPFPQFKRGDNTCWLRVSEAWAGRHFGTQFLPRIGQEVIVSFIDGDPDRPIITGRVYNAANADSTPNLPFPDPAKQPTAVTQEGLLTASGSPNFRFAGIKTQSIGAPGEAPPPSAVQEKRYHLLRLDDTYNCEQYLIRSQGRLDVTAFASSFETTYGNKNVKVVQGKLPNGEPVGGNMYTTVQGEYDLHVGGNRYEKVEKDYEVTVNGTTRAHVKGNLIAIVDGTASVGVKNLVIEAQEKITLKVGASFITIDHCEIHIQAPAMIYENCGGTPGNRLDLAMIPVADASPAEPGDEWYKRTTECTDQGKGGTRKPVPVNFQKAPACDKTVNGVACNFLGDSPAQDSSPSPPGLPDSTSG